VTNAVSGVFLPGYLDLKFSVKADFSPSLL